MQEHVNKLVLLQSRQCSTTTSLVENAVYTTTMEVTHSQKGMPCYKDTDNTPQVGFSHSSIHIELSTNKPGVHSRSLGSDRTRTRCELRSKATTHNAGGTSMVHSKGSGTTHFAAVITCGHDLRWRMWLLM